ncbi:gamma-glutamyltransferase [Enhygromyxa salina]|uniref:Glutathione hydrolase proenzyme n=1 Tax=Enhygromyxa salina TaxID=215803 RepID=A0A2S9YYA1_9BACT|nr:gamma-glutamyltransferase [Enhygromyxa salina]PRQ10070.1 Gamma-glutamyltranspeptidase precursor [Enhygromyxa salina]
MLLETWTKSEFAQSAGHPRRARDCGLVVSALLGTVSPGCNQESPEAWRNAPLIVPDSTLPDDDDSWKQPPKLKPGTGKAFRDGVVTTSEPEAASAGAGVLAGGGNAFDAAAAVMFMLNVVEPQSSGIGGGGFVIFHLAESNETLTLNCRERAPADTTADMFVSQPDFAQRSASGYAVGVPGTVLCAATLLDNWGTITLDEALQPAIAAATDGIVVSTRLAADVLLPKLSNELAPPNNPVKPAYDVARAVFRPNGSPLQAGDLLVQPELAHTLQLIADGGTEAFYRCDHDAGIAEAILATQLVTRTDTPQGVGRMTCADLESYHVTIGAPVSRPYRGYEVASMGPPSSGGVALLQILAMLEGFPIGDSGAGFGLGQVSSLNVMLEAMRLAFADRARWLGDQDCLGCPDLPIAGLLADAYLAERAALIQVGQRRTGITAGDPRPFDPDFIAEGASLGPVSFAHSDPGGDTSHVTIIDADGNIVAFTNSIEATWGTGLMVPGYGFLLNNQLTDFNQTPAFNPNPMSFNPGANDAAPGKRPRSSMAPTLVTLEGDPVAAYGSPGGATIINSVLNVTLNLIDHRLTLQQSVVAPRVSLTTASDAGVAEREAGFDPQVLGALGALGYAFVQVATIGAVQAIVTIPTSKKQYGAADSRRIGGVATPGKVK